jgi:hypothetical protein
LNDKIDLLLTGTFFHLWFLGSLLFGYIITWYFHAIQQLKALYALGFMIILLALFSDSYDLVLGKQVPFDLPQFLLSIPFLTIGLIIGRKERIGTSKMYLWALVVIGFFIQFGETILFENNFGLNRLYHVFLVGTFIFSVPLFIVAINTAINDNRFSRWGLKYSLFIYLYHMWALIIIDSIAKRVVPHYLLSVQVVYPIIAFLLTLTTAIFLDKFLPSIFAILIGDFSRFAKRNTQDPYKTKSDTEIVAITQLQLSEKKV